MDYIKNLKLLIDKNDLEAFKSYVFETNIEENVDFAYIFQKVYLHACLLKRQDFAEWMRINCYEYLSPIEQMSIRQMFSYGNHLLNK